MSSSLKVVDQLNVAGRRVFVRVDFNVPRQKTADGVNLLDDTRIVEALPTIRYLIQQKAKIILASHLGRPKGRDPQASLLVIAEKLTELLDREILFPEDCIGDAVKKLAHDLREGEILLLENLRFHPEEEANDAHFCDQLAQLAEVYVTDAFGVLHRAHASTSGMVSHFKEKGIGFLVKKELENLDKLNSPARPFFAVLGGAKVADKMGLIEHLLTKIDGLLLGGGLSYTFLKANGEEIGKSKIQEEKIYLSHKILEKAKENAVELYLPKDHRVAPEFSLDAPSKVVTKIPSDQMALDIGPQTVQEYRKILKGAKTIFWNGPLGVFEFPAFAEGTMAMARAIAEASDAGAFTVVGGGESVAAIKQSGMADKISYLSTGGGATLEYLEGKTLPGLRVLAE